MKTNQTKNALLVALFIAIGINVNAQIYTVPFTEDFDGPTWVAGGGATSQIDPDWTATPPPTVGTSIIFKWIPSPGLGNGPTVDYTGNNFMYAPQDAGLVSGLVADLITPSIDLSSVSTTPVLYFHQHRYIGPGVSNLADMDVDVTNDDGITWTNVYNVNVPTHPAATSPWTEITVNLSAFAGDTIKIRFRQTSKGCCGDPSIDNVRVLGNCVSSTNAIVSNITATSADVSWTPGSATDWLVEYGPSGFSIGTGTKLTVSGTPMVNLTSLSNSTQYDVYITDSCGASDYSLPLQTSLNTLCNTVFSAPYTEDFDGSTWVAGGGATSQVDPCWVATPPPTVGTSIIFKWIPSPGLGNGPTVDYTGNNFMYAPQDAGLVSGLVADLISPPIDISSLSIPTLFFHQHRYIGPGVSNLADMDVDVTNDGGVTWTNVYSINTPTHPSATSPWTEVVVNLNAFIGDTVRVRFRQTSKGCCGDPSIDNIRLDEGPCPPSTNISVTHVTATTADVSWIPVIATSWMVEYGPAGFTPGSGTFIHVTPTPSVTLTSLSNGTHYDVYVYDSCAVVGLSDPIKESFTTVCTTVYPAPFVEDFDGANWLATADAVGNVIDPCWTSNPPTSTGLSSIFKWIPSFGLGNGPVSDFTGGRFMYSPQDAGLVSGLISDLITPQIDVSTLIAPTLYFHQHRYRGGGTSSIADMDVDVTNDGGATWTNVYSITGQTHSSASSPWTEIMVDLSSYAGDTIQVRFRQTSKGCCGDPSIDNVRVEDAPCDESTSLMASNITNSSALLSWNSGGASNWIVEYGVQGFTLGTGTRVSTSSKPILITSLAQGTCYDFYVQDSCGPNSLSIFSGPTTFCTDACNPIASFVINPSSPVSGDSIFSFVASTSVQADSIYWDFGDGTFNPNGSLNESHTYDTTANGGVTVTLTVCAKCSDGTILCDNVSRNININGIGIWEDDFGSSFNLYPNPTSGSFIIDLGKYYQSLTVKVTNMYGQLVSESEMTNIESISIDLLGATGVYFVELVTDGGQSKTFKVFKSE